MTDRQVDAPRVDEPTVRSRSYTSEGAPVLAVSDLQVEFYLGRSWVTAVEDVSFHLERNEVLGLVGESGSGKTATAMAVVGLSRHQGGRVSGSVQLAGQELVGLPERKLTSLRGADLGMIFQQPTRSLNPAFTVGEQIAETVRMHFGLGRKQAWRHAVEALDRVRIPRAAERAREYPHAFSGGMCQRVMIALALCCQPRVLIADEPTTALDVTIQDEILALLRDLQEETDLSVLFITHDLGVVAEICDRVAVMYAGQIVEVADVDSLFRRPAHPYTSGLLSAMPRPGVDELAAIPGVVPQLGRMPDGCRFHPRCAHAVEGRCDAGHPALAVGSGGRLSRCVRTSELELPGVQT